MNNKPTIELLQAFLNENLISIKLDTYVNTIKKENIAYAKLNAPLFDNIIVDSYNGYSEVVKSISNFFINHYNIYFGRQEKLLIKKFLDYGNEQIIEKLAQLYSSKCDLISILKKYRDDNNDKILSDNKTLFFEKLNTVILKKDEKRISDYLNFLYSKMLRFREFSKRSVADFFNENSDIIRKEYGKEKHQLLKEKCDHLTLKEDYNTALKLYLNLFNEIIFSETKQTYDIIYLNINQELFNSFNSIENFYSYIFSITYIVYEQLSNHRTYAIKIENVFYNEINIKWEIYSYLTLYTENSRESEVNGQFYKPDEICNDFLTHKYQLRENQSTLLKKYFSNDINFDVLKTNINPAISKSEIDYFKTIKNGFHFQDCIILKSNKKFENSKQINFIKNRNELLLLFSKNDSDSRKIPCPVCGSLKISSNSYSDVGIQSWECKNSVCSDRSKTNRGKRYSVKSVEMQNALTDINENNFIEKEFIAKWRRDIVENKTTDDICEMLIRYFSFANNNVLLINENSKIPNYFLSRKIEKISFNDFQNVEKINNQFDFLKNSEWKNKFIYQKPHNNQQIEIEYLKENNWEIINSDCLSFLQNTQPNSIANMITSPPYYNAREYSQWQNLYNYCNDMYEICLASYNALIGGGVFFYNIGDVFGNPNTVVKSNMGNKRLALGAYIIYIFQQAGFKILDNIIWDKGEVQSNRQKNDGNFTPYYQRPANCYENIFIFYKPTAPIRLNDRKEITENVLRFSPVIKINSKGENTFGHTAPYPMELPRFSINTFSLKNDIIFDPFLGSGTTVYTAVRNNRIGIGTELNRQYYKLAIKNIKSFVQPDLFSL